jgi:hypothetical protein
MEATHLRRRERQGLRRVSSVVRRANSRSQENDAMKYKLRVGPS